MHYSYQTFVSQRIPKSFLDEIGNQVSSSVIVKCGNIAWKAKIENESSVIFGLRRFMRFFEVKLWNLVQFDYYGNNLFIVHIFKDNAVESKYPKIDPEEFFKNENMNSWREEQYVIDFLSMEYQKSCALWTFNAYTDCVPYYNVKIGRLDIDENVEKLVRIFKNLCYLYDTYVCLVTKCS